MHVSDSPLIASVLFFSVVYRVLLAFLVHSSFVQTQDVFWRREDHCGASFRGSAQATRPDHSQFTG